MFNLIAAATLWSRTKCFNVSQKRGCANSQNANEMLVTLIRSQSFLYSIRTRNSPQPHLSKIPFLANIKCWLTPTRVDPQLELSQDSCVPFNMTPKELSVIDMHSEWQVRIILNIKAVLAPAPISTSPLPHPNSMPLTGQTTTYVQGPRLAPRRLDYVHSTSSYKVIWFSVENMYSNHQFVKQLKSF